MGDEVFGAKAGSNAEYVPVAAAVAAARGADVRGGGCDPGGALLALTCMSPAYPVQGKGVLVFGAGGVESGTAAVSSLCTTSAPR